jgi:hypothetical protein
MIDKDKIVSVTKDYLVGATTSHGYVVVYNINETCSVPLDEANTDYQEIQEWAKIEGNNIIDNGA